MPRPAALALRVFLVTVFAAGALAPAEARRPRRPPPPPVSGGGDSGGTVGAASACGALSPAEVSGLLAGAAAAIGVPDLAVAVVDRPGNLLGLYVQGSPTPAQRETALGLARTGAFFS